MSEKKKGLLGNLNMGDMLMGMVSDKAMIKSIGGMLSNAIDKMAPKMNDDDCLFCAPSGDKTKLRMMRGKYTTNAADRTITITITGGFDIAELVSGIDHSKLTKEQQEKVTADLNI